MGPKLAKGCRNSPHGRRPDVRLQLVVAQRSRTEEDGHSIRDRTEIGISREKSDGLDCGESIALVAAHGTGVRMCWDYSCEDLIAMRAVSASRNCCRTSTRRTISAGRATTLTFNEIKSDLVLRNGARF